MKTKSNTNTKGTRTTSPRATSGEGGESHGAKTMEDKIRGLNSDNGVVIYSKSWCPFCSQAKTIFDQLDVEYFCLELDEFEEGQEIQDCLAGITGIRTVPQVFVGNELIGGCDDTKASLAKGELQQLVSKL
jgi:glutaredoxin 3